MKALAEYILRGRLQSLIVALVGFFFPLISSAAIALVTLSKGAKEGILLFLWISLALVLIQQAGSEKPLLTIVSIASIGLMVVAAKVHKTLASWQWTLLTIILVASFVSMTLGILKDSFVTDLVVASQEMFNALVSEDNAQRTMALNESMKFGFIDTGLALFAIIAGITLVTKSFALGFIAVLLATGSIMSLMLARWWQADVFNPGGFQNEFHSFTIEAKVAVFLFFVLMVGLILPQSAQIWAELAVLPLLVAGISLIHFTVRLFRKPETLLAFETLLALIYVGMIMVGKPVLLVLVLLALTDSLIDLRSRLEGYKNSKA